MFEKASIQEQEKNKRRIQINVKLEVYKAQARANLESERGKHLREQRGIDAESVFGDIK